MSPAELLADSLAAHRLTRLVTADVITQPLRDRILAWAWRGRRFEVVHAAEQRGDIPDAGLALVCANRAGGRLQGILPEGAIQEAMKDGQLGDPPKLATLITCRWCAGVYVAAAVVALRAANPRGWSWAARGLACASAAALWAAIEDR